MKRDAKGRFVGGDNKGTKGCAKAKNVKACKARHDVDCHGPDPYRACHRNWFPQKSYGGCGSCGKEGSGQSASPQCYDPWRPKFGGATDGKMVSCETWYNPSAVTPV